jgi:hypothetical protein
MDYPTIQPATLVLMLLVCLLPSLAVAEHEEMPSQGGDYLGSWNPQPSWGGADSNPDWYGHRSLPAPSPAPSPFLYRQFGTPGPNNPPLFLLPTPQPDGTVTLTPYRPPAWLWERQWREQHGER